MRFPVSVSSALLRALVGPGVLRVALIFVAFGVGACGVGNAGFSGQIGEQGFAPTGTVFAFSDALKPAPDLSGRDDVRLNVVLTYAAFDPSQDLQFKSGAELADLQHSIEISDWLSLSWKDRDKLGADTRFTDVLLAADSDGRFSESDDTAEARSDGFSARFGLARSPLNPGASYADYQPFASRALVTVDLQEAQLDPGGVLSGEMTIKIERSGDDPAEAKTGEIKGQFSAQVIAERVAEKNCATLDLYKLMQVPR